MSIAVVISVHDGLVMAADSASTLTVSTAPGVIAGVANVYDNANKIFNLYKGKPIGLVAFGTGSIGNSSIGTLIKDLRVMMMDQEKARTLDPPFDETNYTMEGVAQIVSNFLGRQCADPRNAAMMMNLNIGILLCGYSTPDGQGRGSLGELWNIEIQRGVPQAPRLRRQPHEAGIDWGGASEIIHRIVLGFSPLLYQALAEVSGTPNQRPTPQQLAEQLNALLMSRLQAPLVFPPMPIQDAIDLARFLVHAACMYSRFLPGVQIVGGPIEIAAITKHEHFKWISRKHYYDYSLNQEPRHVLIDR